MPTFVEVKGRKRHSLVDPMRLPISFHVTPASVHDTCGKHRLLVGLKDLVPRLTKPWADQAYQGQALYDWCKGPRVAGNSKSSAAHPERAA